MASGWPRPTLASIAGRMKGYITSEVTGAELSLRRHVLRIVSDAVSMGLHTLYGYVAYVSRQILPTSADEDNLGFHATIRSVPRLDASAAAGNATFTGTVAATVPAGTTFARADGVIYETDALATIGGAGSVTTACTAVEAGEDGNCDAFTAGTLTSPVASINAAVTVAVGGMTGGTDEEAVEAWRSRILDRWRNPPQGGAETDYVQWAEAAGADRAWAQANYLGAGTVGVWFTTTDGPIPGAGEVADVDAYIQARRPVTADVTVAAPVAVPIDPTIAVSPDTAAIRAAVQAEIEALLLQYVGGDTVYLSQLGAAISQAEGEESHVMSLPAANVVLAVNEVPTLGTITWV